MIIQILIVGINVLDLKLITMGLMSDILRKVKEVEKVYINGIQK